MTSRSTAELIAVLRFDDGISTPTFGDLAEAADRLTELDAEVGTLKQQIAAAASLAEGYGRYDGAHHKMWVIDQMLRELLDVDYERVVSRGWDEGIAP